MNYINSLKKKEKELFKAKQKIKKIQTLLQQEKKYRLLIENLKYNDPVLTRAPGNCKSPMSFSKFETPLWCRVRHFVSHVFMF